MFVASLVRAFARSPPASPPLCFGRSVVAASLPALPVVCSAHLACPSSFPPPPVRPLIQPFRARAPPPSLVCSHRGPAMPCVRASSRPPCLPLDLACLPDWSAGRPFVLLAWLARSPGRLVRSLVTSVLLACLLLARLVCLFVTSVRSVSLSTLLFFSFDSCVGSVPLTSARAWLCCFARCVRLASSRPPRMCPAVRRACSWLPASPRVFVQPGRSSLARSPVCVLLRSLVPSVAPASCLSPVRSFTRSFVRSFCSLVRSCVPHLSPCVWLAGWLCLSLRS